MTWRYNHQGRSVILAFLVSYPKRNSYIYLKSIPSERTQIITQILTHEHIHHLLAVEIDNKTSTLFDNVHSIIDSHIFDYPWTYL